MLQTMLSVFVSTYKQQKATFFQHFTLSEERKHYVCRRSTAWWRRYKNALWFNG